MKEGIVRKAAEISSLPIISILQGAQLGRIKEGVVDPRKKEVIAFLVEDADWYKSRKVLPFSSVKSIGQDAIIIERAEQIVEMKDAKSIEAVARQGIEVVGSNVMTVGGRAAGKVVEYSFDLDSGSLVALDVEEAGKSSSVSLDKIVTIGKDAVIMAEEGEEELAATVKEVEEISLEEPAVEEPVVEEEPKVEEIVEEPVVEEEPKVEEAPPAPPAEETPPEAVMEEPVAEAPAEKPEEKAEEAPGLKARQEDYLLGKTITKDIMADDGTVIISAGETITEEVIKKAKEAKKFLMLSFWVER